MEWYVLVLMLTLPSLSWADCSEQCLKCALKISDSPLNLLVRSSCCPPKKHLLPSRKRSNVKKKHLKTSKEKPRHVFVCVFYESHVLGLKNKPETRRRVCFWCLSPMNRVDSSINCDEMTAA